jgi:hypothetical protein
MPPFFGNSMKRFKLNYFDRNATKKVYRFLYCMATKITIVYFEQTEHGTPLTGLAKILTGMAGLGYPQKSRHNEKSLGTCVKTCHVLKKGIT